MDQKAEAVVEIYTWQAEAIESGYKFISVPRRCRKSTFAVNTAKRWATEKVGQYLLCGNFQTEHFTTFDGTGAKIVKLENKVYEVHLENGSVIAVVKEGGTIRGCKYRGEIYDDCQLADYSRFAYENRSFDFLVIGTYENPPSYFKSFETHEQRI